MPKTPGSSPKAKAEPYRKESPKKQAAIKITWTEEADRAMIRHVLSISEIKLRYNWTELQKSTFPDLTVKQLENHWNAKVKGVIFPPDLIKLSKQAKEEEGKS